MKNRQLVLLAATACVGAALSKPVTGQDLQQPHPIPPARVCQPLAGITTYSYGVCVLGIHLDTNAKFVGYCFVLSIATLCAKACQIPTNYSKDSSDRKPSGGHFLVQLVFPAVEYTLLGIIAMTTPWANMWWAISTGIGYFFGNAAVIAFSP